MNIRQITGPVAALIDPAALLVVNLKDRQALATELARALEAKAVALATLISSCDDATEQQLAVTAQTTLARYVKAVHAAAEAAKKPLNELRSKIITLDKELVARAESEGARIGTLIADFQIAEETRVAALRRLQTLEATKLEQEQDKRLSEANSVAEQEAIRDEFRAELAAAAPLVEPIRAPGQVVKEEWEIQVSDIWLLARAMPSCVKMEPRLSEIKSLLSAGVKVPGIIAVKKTVAGVRLAPGPKPIEVTAVKEPYPFQQRL